MSFDTLHHNALDQKLNYTVSRSSTAFSNLTSHTGCHSCSGLGSNIGLSSIGQTVCERNSCLGEPDVARCCRFPANAEERQHPPGCIDPACTETICDECSNHDDCCDDCVMDCGSDCGISLDCDELDNRVDDIYSLEGSQSELFGDQTAQTFGFGRSLPRLTVENTTIESTDFDRSPDHTTLSTLPEYDMNQTHLGSRMQPKPSFQMPGASHTQVNAPQATTPSRSKLTPADISPLAHNRASFIYLSDSTHDSPDSIDSTPRAHYDHINLVTEKSDSKRPFPTSLLCQWADSNGQPCGKALGMGNDMHEHLKSVHGVKSEVFCRWVGCSVGVLEASPHRFASSVERHTWGHSGYRPYKCSACNEGFAAASVRDEHFTNIHLRKKIFSCDMCSHQCTSATNLKRHKDDKHSAERFQCEFCNRNGKRRLFPRGPNLARHFRNCKYVQVQSPEAAATGKVKLDWLPPGYKRGHHGLDRAKVIPPNYLPSQSDA